MSRYDFELDLSANDTSAFIVENIIPDSVILEFGAAHGRLTKYLTEQKNCIVDIVEIDQVSGENAAVYAREKCIGETDGDIETYVWKQQFEGQKYDCIIFADVLEHLRRPECALAECKSFLKPEGRIIVSLPNIAHNAVIAGLLDDDFSYSQTGLLDDTHLRFFTYETFEKTINAMGFRIVKNSSVVHSVEETEFHKHCSNMSRTVRKALNMHKSGCVYQNMFVLQKGERINNLRTSENHICEYYDVVCYISDADGNYSEERTIRKGICPGKNDIYFDLKNWKEMKSLRIDPLNVNCMVKVKSTLLLENQKEVLDAQGINGYLIDRETFFFATDDPQIQYDLNGKNVDGIRISLEFLDYDMECAEQIAVKMQGLISYREKLAREQMIVAEKDNELQTVYNSLSWKITRPLRKIKDLFKK